MTIGTAPAGADDGLQCDFGTEGDNQIGLQPHQVGRGDKRPAWVIQVSIFDDDILALVEAKLPQPRHEGLVWDDRRRAREARAEKPDPHDLAGLLCARRERPRTAAPPSSVMNSRRLISNMGASPPNGCRRHRCHQRGGTCARFAARSACRGAASKSLGRT